MPIPDFIVDLRAMVGTHPLWMPGVTAVIRKQSDILLVRRADNHEWTPVTGIVDPEEEPAVCAAREAMEETGVRIRVDRLACVSVVPQRTYPNGDRTAYLDLTFACTWIAGEPHVADDESVEVRWWPVADLPGMSPGMHRRIEAGLSNEVAARFIG